MEMLPDSILSSKWTTIPEDILFIILEMVDDDDTNDLIRPTDQLDGGLEIMSWRIRYIMKPGLLAMRQVCSYWRSVASSTRESLSQWMTILLWSIYNSSINIEQDLASAKAGLLKHDGNTDYGVRASSGSAHQFNLLHAAIIPLCHRRLCLLKLFINFDTDETIPLHETFPKLSCFVYTGLRFMTLDFICPVSRLEQLTIFPAMMSKLVSVIVFLCEPDLMPHKSQNITSQFSRLQHLTIHLRRQETRPAFENMDMPQLTDLVLYCDGIDLALSALQSLSAVNLLSLMMSDSSWATEQHRTRIECNLPIRMFPRLTILDLSHLPFCLTMRIITTLECPSMTHLGMTLCYKTNCDRYQACDISHNRTKLSVTSFTVRSRFRLPNYEGLKMTMQDIVSSLQMPHLKELHFGLKLENIEQCRYLAKLFGDIQVIRLLSRGRDEYHLTLTHQGSSQPISLLGNRN
jgi:hypothetical protein